MNATTACRPRGFSMIGMLITLVCILILFVILMNSVNFAVTGAGSARDGTVRTVQDQIALYGLFQSMTISAMDHGDSRFVVPSVVSRSGDRSQDTTANLFSAMIALRYANPESLIAANEFNPYVLPMEHYNYNAYDPQRESFWDKDFKADLGRNSNVSFAHMPLFGDRFERGWKSNFDRRAVIIGNRGPKDGIDDPQSYSYGRSGQWGGNVLFGDGSIEFYHTFSPPGVTFERSREQYADNIFAMEDGPDGRDAILSFTKSMTRSGPELQWD